MKIDDIKLNENNPRIISDEKLDKLCNSIKSFSKMMELRPIIVDKDMIILGGNMRYKALQKLGYTEIPDDWVKIANELTEDEKKQFIIEDNVMFGEWDFNKLKENWELDKLNEWGLFIPDIDSINELEEWDKNNMPEFELPEKELYITIYFENEEQRTEYAEQHNLQKDFIRNNQWIIRPYQETYNRKKDE